MTGMDFDDISGVALAVSRFLHYLTTTTLFGAALFPLYAWRGTSRPETPERGQRMLLVSAAVSSFLTALLWLVFTAANMSGDVTAAAEPGLIGEVLRSTDFGTVWAVRLVLGLVVIAVALMSRPGTTLWTAVLSGALLASLALTGHARREAGVVGGAHVLTDAVHLLAAGLWLGALVPIGVAIRRSIASELEPEQTARMLMRFSTIAIGAVAALVATGLINAVLIVGSVPAMVDTTYGLVLCAKLAAFAGMLGLAAMNRSLGVGAGGQTPDPRWLYKLRRNIVAEQALGVLVLALVGALGMLEPPT